MSEVNTSIANKTIIAKVNLNLSAIPKDKIFSGKKGKYIDVTFVVNQELDQFGNNGPVYVSQSKEERDAKVEREYLGNSKVVAVFDEQQGGASKAQETQEDGLPF